MYFTDSHGKYMVWMYSVIAHLISLIRISFRYVTYIQRMASGSRKRKRIAFSLDLSPVGISLTSESCCNQDGQQHHHANLGFILVNPEDTVVNDLRGVIGNQLETVPVNYRFLTKQGLNKRLKSKPVNS
eukprot:XP_011674495.1 PREDICTED: uncharacterized protein LOC105443241 [Strongylocentrotus purpuratus]